MISVCVLAARGLWYGIAVENVTALVDGEFEDEIRAFEEADRTHPIRENVVLFIGSSSIRFWASLERDMAPLTVLNRGFGGAHISHLIKNAPRLVWPYSPQAIVVYGGDNDLAGPSRKTPETVLADYKRFVSTVRQALPQVQVYFLSIKPSPSRWKTWPHMKKANMLIKTWSGRYPYLHFIDVASVLLNEGGQPNIHFFEQDGLHLNNEGYRAWTAIVRDSLTTNLR